MPEGYPRISAAGWIWLSEHQAVLDTPENRRKYLRRPVISAKRRKYLNTVVRSKSRRDRRRYSGRARLGRYACAR